MKPYIKDWEEGDRVVINYGDGDNWLGTITLFEYGKITILFDDGDGETLPLRSRHIVGRGVKRTRKKPIKDADVKKYLLKNQKRKTSGKNKAKVDKNKSKVKNKQAASVKNENKPNGNGADKFVDLKKKLWEAADDLRANSNLSSHQYSMPVLGLIFLKYADQRFQAVKEKLSASRRRSRRRKTDSRQRYLAEGVLYLRPEAQFGCLAGLAEGEDIGKAVNEAMKAVDIYTPVAAKVGIKVPIEIF